MNNQADESRSRRHSLSDWLTAHELDPVTCRGILDAMTPEAADEQVSNGSSNLAYQAPDLEAVWLSIAEAMRTSFSEQRVIIDETFHGTVKICVDQRDNSRKALTLDNGSAAYPTIIFSFRGHPSDSLIIAHEFGHALQLSASRGIFVPPIIREVCAFLGEGALLSHTQHSSPAQYAHLSRVWREDTTRYFGAQRDRLKAALLEPDAPYKYFWNYPIARYLAIRISERCSEKWIWSLFAGETSVQEALRKII